MACIRVSRGASSSGSSSPSPQRTGAAASSGAHAQVPAPQRDNESLPPMPYEEMDNLPSPVCSPTIPFATEDRYAVDNPQVKVEPNDNEQDKVKEQEPDPVPDPQLPPAQEDEPEVASWTLALPSIYATPPAAQRRRFRLAVRHNPHFMLEVEEGALAIDYARSIRFWQNDGTPRLNGVHSDDEAEIAENAHLLVNATSEFGILRGGSRTRAEAG